MTKDESPVVSIVAPVFNEDAIVDELLDRCLAAGRTLGVPFEVVIVNDGSRDATLERLVERSRTEPELRVVDLLRNFGHMQAVTAGVAAARGDAVVLLDGDLQDPPELIPAFVDAWRAGADVVYGLRTERHETAIKQFFIGVFYSVLHTVADARIPRQVGTFSLMDRRVVDALNAMPERHRYFAGLRAWAGGVQTFVPYERVDRTNGRSRVGVKGLVSLARTALLSFSKVPLRATGVLAFLVCLGLLVAGLAGLLFGSGDSLVPVILAVVGGIGAVQALAIATIAEYVAVIVDEVKARPLFIVRQEFREGAPLPPPGDGETRAWTYRRKRRVARIEASQRN